MKRILVVIAVAACGHGSGGGGGTGAVTDTEAEQICTDDCQHQLTCGDIVEADVPDCVTSCKGDMVGWARADAIEEVFDCRVALACGASGDGCTLGVDPLPIHQEWEDKCRVQLATCVDPTEIDQACEVSPGANDIGIFRFIAPAIMTELIACLDGADCTARLQCVQDTLDAHGIDF